MHMSISVTEPCITCFGYNKLVLLLASSGILLYRDT